jgi:hypothetical protein
MPHSSQNSTKKYFKKVLESVSEDFYSLDEVVRRKPRLNKTSFDVTNSGWDGQTRYGFFQPHPLSFFVSIKDKTY